METHWVNILRLIIIAQGFATFFLIILILVRYAQILMKKTLSRMKDSLTPWHILTLALSHMLMTVFVVATLIDRLNQPMSWRIPVAIFSFTLADVGLVIMIAHLRKKIDELYRF